MVGAQCEPTCSLQRVSVATKTDTEDTMEVDGCTVESPPSSQNQSSDCVIVDDGNSCGGKDSANSKKETARKRQAASPKGKKRNKSSPPSSNNLTAQQNNLKLFLESAPNKKPKLDNTNDVIRRLDVDDDKEQEVGATSESSKNIPVTPVRCEYLSDGNWLDARVVDTKVENEKKLLGIQLVYKAEGDKGEANVVWEEQCSESVRYPDQTTTESAIDEPENSVKDQDESNEKAVGSCKKKATGGRQKAVARVKPVVTAAPTDLTMNDGTNSVPATNAKQPSATSKASKVKEIISQEERERRDKLIREELSILAALKPFSENIPMLRPTVEELADLEDMKEIDGPLPIKIRQLIARFLEGRSQEKIELIDSIKAFMEATEEGKATLERIELTKLDGLTAQLGDFVDCRPVYETNNPPASVEDIELCCGAFVRRFEVRDMADIPEKFRVILDVNRKLEAGVKERMRHLLDMLKEVKVGGKNLAKMDKALIGMKDRYAKLEERERKEREKLEVKLEADRKRLEEAKKKLEEARKRQEEKDEKLRKKEEEAKGKEKKEQEKVKDVTKSKQASFMANFFKKPAGGAAAASAKSVSTNSSGSAASSGTPTGESDKDCGGSAAGGGKHAADGQETAAPPARAHRNFHPWEKPRYAVVAGFPYGPGDGTNRDPCEASPPPAGSELQSWVAHWRQQRHERRCVDAAAAKPVPLREDGTPHPRMKMIQLAMQVPETRTQLVDVDVDAPKKVVWDVESDPKEEQLQTILGEAEQMPDGLYRWKGRILQFVTEGGGWFESRRPPYFGTWSKKAANITGRRPLAKEPELDYDYESDADWESEAGEGEELGSEVDMDEEGEDGDADGDEDGGFVVPDGYSSDRDMPDAAPACGSDTLVIRRPGTKLQPVVYHRASMPAELCEALAAQPVDELPLVLSRDPNLAVEEDTDFFGEDVVSVRAPTLEAALLRMHQHPTACSLTYVLPTTESKFAGHAFLKTAAAPNRRTAAPGMLSAYIRQVPAWKLAAIQAQEAASAKELAAAAAAAAAAEQAAATAAEKAAPQPPQPVQLSEAQMQTVVRLVHGSKRGKAELVEEVVAGCPGLSKKKADRAISQLASKKAGRWSITEDTLSKNPSLSDIATQAWETNSATPPPAPASSVATSSSPPPPAPATAAPAPAAAVEPAAPAAESTPPKGPAQQRLCFRPVPKPAAPAAARQPAAAAAAARSPGATASPAAAAADDVIVLEEFGCLPIPN